MEAVGVNSGFLFKIGAASRFNGQYDQNNRKFRE